MPAVQGFFLLTAFLSVGLMAWLQSMRLDNVTRGLSFIFMKLFLYEDRDALMAMLATLAVLAALPVVRGERRVLAWIGARPGLIGVLVTVVLCAGALLVYQAHPLSMDEYAPMFQSQAFAAGHLEGRFPPAVLDGLVPYFFQNVFLRVSPTTGGVISAYWPSFALLLTPFTLIGASWACNAVLSGLTIVVIRRLALELLGSEEGAGLAMLLTLASPVFFADGISYYSMTAHMLFNGVFALLLLRPTPRRLFLAGVAGSIALTLHNPVPHTLFAAPWIVWLAFRGRGVRDVAWLVAGYLPLGLPLLPGWFWFSSHLMHEGVPAGNADALAAAGSLVTWPTATVALSRVIGLAKVWIWAVPGLLPLAAMGAWRWRRHPYCMLFAASAVTTFAGYFFFTPDQGHGWGFRYFHSAWLALPLLAAAALTPRPADPAGDVPKYRALRGFMINAALLTLVVGVGLRAWQIGHFIADDLAQLPAYAGKEPRIVLVNPYTTNYGGDLVQNDPFLRGDVIRMLMPRPDAIESEVHRLRPDFHRVFADEHGEVWSAAAPAPSGVPARGGAAATSGSAASQAPV